MKPYDHKDIEQKWQKAWEGKQIYKTSDSTDKPKHYILDMFPYPSGEGLHVGHPRGYIATDVYSRKKRMEGFNVLHPMGWDAFGLPAENFAIKNKIHPREAVEHNVARFKEQLSLIGLDYDWSREINTTDPTFYKWTQWIFLQLYKKGLAYESHEPINWCPSCQTGLANEDVEADGTCERCGTKVEKKPIRQWVLKITDYADRMLADLDKLPKWPEGVKEAQRHWIGKSEGSEISFSIKDSSEKIDVFTTRADTLFGVTYVVLAPEHLLVSKLEIHNTDEVEKYVRLVAEKTPEERTNTKKEKTGVELKGVKAINPANGEEVPVWIADYVLAGYGTGAVMAVPAHDERDFEFAKKYDLPVKEVIIPNRIDIKNPPVLGKKSGERKNVQGIVRDPKTGKYLLMYSKEFKWTTFPMGGIEEGENLVEAVAREIREETGYSNLKFVKVLGGQVRAEYFATHKDENRVAYTSAVVFDLIDDKQVPVLAEEEGKHDLLWLDKSELVYPRVVHAELNDWLARWDEVPAFTEYGVLIDSGEFTGLSSQEAKEKITDFVGGKIKSTYKIKDWVFSRQRYWGEPIPLIHCEKCGVVAVPESELPVLLPEVKNYEPSGTGESPLATILEWVNVVCPTCAGDAKRETNTMPQWAGSSWYYLRYIDPTNNEALIDPQKEKEWMSVDVYVGGDHATRHLIYARFWHKFLFDIGVVSTEEPFPRLEFLGFILGPDGKKFSKRLKNGISPDDVINTFGADAFRLYEMFIGPFENTSIWNPDGPVGTYRFLERVWRLMDKIDIEKKICKTDNLVHKTIKSVTEDIEVFKFNTAVAKMMILLNALEKEEKIVASSYRALLQLLAPFAPHMTEELWAELGETESIHLSPWPTYDSALLVEDTVTIAVQINSKVRAELVIASDATKESIEQAALALPRIAELIAGKEIKKVIVIPGRIINIVL